MNCSDRDGQGITESESEYQCAIIGLKSRMMDIETNIKVIIK
jgi:hypothetical protein